jgi:hypothetical protein
MDHADARVALPLGSQIIEGAVLFPTLRRPDMPGRLLMGVRDAAGNVLADSLLKRRSGEQGWPMPAGELQVDVSAAVHEGIYCGPLYFHFGHFLVESLARIWYARQHPDVPLIWAGASAWAKDASFKAWQMDILDILGVTNPRRVATTPIPVARLHMPDIGYRYDDWLHPDHAEVLAAYRGPAQDDTVKIWLSRSRVGSEWRDLNAVTIERRLEAAGWMIVYPEQLTIRGQLDILSRASVIAGEEGSAFHALILLDDVRGKKLHVFRRLGGEHGNMRTIGDARGINQEFHSLRNEVVIKATGRYVTKVSANASEVLDILAVPVPDDAPAATEAGAAAIVARVAHDFAASSYLEVGVGEGSAIPLVTLPRCAAIAERFPFDPRAYETAHCRLFELPIEQYLTCFDDRRRYDIIRLAAPTVGAGLRAMIGTQALARHDSVWLADLPPNLAQSDLLLLLVSDALPSLVLRTFEHEGVRRAIARRGVGGAVVPVSPTFDVLSIKAKDARALVAPLEADGLDAAIEALPPAIFDDRLTSPDPAMSALAAENAALKRRLRRLRAEKQRLERTPTHRVRQFIERARKAFA